jgi:hypothetical protein
MDTSGTGQSWWIDVYLFSQVENLEQIHARLTGEGGLELSLLDPRKVSSTVVLQLAATHALHTHYNKQLKCHSVYSELLYILYPSHNMRQAFVTFGAPKNGSDLLLVNFHCSSFKVGVQS